MPNAANYPDQGSPKAASLVFMRVIIVAKVACSIHSLNTCK